SFMSRFLRGYGSMANDLGVEWSQRFAADGVAAVVEMEASRDRGVDGVLLMGFEASGVLDDSITAFVEDGIPVLTYDSETSAAPGVRVDDFQLVTALMQYLLELEGGSSAVLYSNSRTSASLERRHKAYRDFVEVFDGISQAGEIVYADDLGSGTAESVALALDSNDEMTSVVALEGDMARDAASVSVGRDVNVYGVDFNDAVITDMVAENSAYVATAGVDPALVGRVSMRLLASLIGGRDIAENTLIEPTLVDRSFLLANSIGSLDDLVAVVPELGVSVLGWEPWMVSLLSLNGVSSNIVLGASTELVLPRYVELPSAQTQNLAANLADLTGLDLAVVRLGDAGSGNSVTYAVAAQFAAAELGFDWEDYSGYGDLSRMATALDEAIAADPDILLVVNGSGSVSDRLEALAADGNVLIAAHNTPVVGDNILRIGDGDFFTGYALMSSLVSTTGGDARVLLLTGSSEAIGENRWSVRTAAYENYLASFPGVLEVNRLSLPADVLLGGVLATSISENVETRELIVDLF
ncbi:MAG: substrate-binding domain-containing protein, partial [Chloroflexota bacterium]